MLGDLARPPLLTAARPPARRPSQPRRGLLPRGHRALPQLQRAPVRRAQPAPALPRLSDRRGPEQLLHLDGKDPPRAGYPPREGGGGVGRGGGLAAEVLLPISLQVWLQDRSTHTPPAVGERNGDSTSWRTPDSGPASTRSVGGAVCAGGGSLRSPSLRSVWHASVCLSLHLASLLACVGVVGCVCVCLGVVQSFSSVPPVTEL